MVNIQISKKTLLLIEHENGKHLFVTSLVEGGSSIFSRHVSIFFAGSQIFSLGPKFLSLGPKFSFARSLIFLAGSQIFF